MENGYYFINYTTVATNAASATPPVTVGVHLSKGGEEIPGTAAITTISTANDTAALSGTTIINVTDSPATITLDAENTNGTFTNTSMTIRKLD